MSTATTATTATSDVNQAFERSRRLTSETKAAFVTTKLIAYFAGP